MKVSAYIATSLDGYIARPDGGLDWLEHDAGGDDYGYHAFMNSVDVLVMGRGTFDTVLTFDEWPYEGLPVVVLSQSLAPSALPERLSGKATVSAKPIAAALDELADKGTQHVYLDGGKLIQSCITEGLLDELTLTRLPILIGRGIPLFSGFDGDVRLKHCKTESFKSGLIQSLYALERAPRK